MKRKDTILLSFLVPFAIVGLILLVAGLMCGVGYTSNDCYEQYLPFFNAYYDILKGHKSMFYSMTGSMGYDFYAVFSYYLVSPLNLIMLVFPKEWIIYVVNVLIVLKIAFSGGTFSVLLLHRYPDAPKSRIVLFSAIYALNGFVAGYFWNVMWMDGILLFPLVIFGLDLLMRDERPVWYWYTLFLAALLIISYFMGYMSCIFILLYFFTYEFKGVKDFLKKFLRIGLASLLAIALSAVILVPSFFGVQSTYISGEVLPDMSFYGNYAQSLATVFVGVSPIGIEFDRQYANLFMTTLVLLLAFMFFVSGRVKVSRKIRQFALLFILIFSFNFKPLNFLWHGLHEQTGIPNRFSFMVIFLMLLMGFEVACQKRKDVPIKTVWIALGIYGVCAAVICFFNREVIIMGALSFGMCLVYALFLLIRRRKLRSVLVSVFAYAEIAGTFIYALFTCSGSLTGNYGYYINDFRRINSSKEAGVYREKLDEVYNEDEVYFENVMDYPPLSEITVDWVKDSVSLMRNVGHQSIVNEATVYGLNSLTLFNTFNNYAQTEFYCDSGNAGGTNNVMYFGDNPLMDMLLGVRYSYIRYADTAGSSYKHASRVGNVDIYENMYALSVGYAVEDEFLDAEWGKTSDFENLNIIAKSLVQRNMYDRVRFTLADDSDETLGEKTFSYTVPCDGEFVIQPDINEMAFYEVYVNDVLCFKSQRNSCLFELGMLSKGDVVTLHATLKNTADTYGSVFGAFVDMSVVKEAYDKLSAEQLTVTEYSDDYICGRISLKNDSKVLITVPQSKGWSITVDGSEYEPELYRNLFYVLDLSAGEHTVMMRYMTPGFMYGVYISLGALAVFAAALVVTLVRRHKKTEDTQKEL